MCNQLYHDALREAVSNEVRASLEHRAIKISTKLMKKKGTEK